jgi:hypothetical protein
MRLFLYESGNMSIPNSRIDLVLEVAKHGHWWGKEDFQIWFRGEAPRRDKFFEHNLPRLVKRRKNNLKLGHYGKKDIYAIPRYYKNFDTTDPDNQEYLYHELACTKTMTRIYRSQMDCEIFHQSVFRGYGSVPEWGIRYENGLMYLGEFSTAADTGKNLSIKAAKYPKSISYIEKDFDAQVIVLFILDVPRWKVQKRVKELKANEPYRFIDYLSFLDAPIGSAFDAPWIYPDGSVGTL